MADKSLLLSQDELKNLLSYDPETGIFVRIVSTNRCIKIGSIPGVINPKGYRRIAVNHKLYFAHRLAWFYVYGIWPKSQLDHVNGKPDDNRIVNLREATGSENQYNRRKNRNNTSGFKGVQWLVRRRKWRALIKVNGKQKHLGHFTDISDAVSAYAVAAKKYHGEFARFE